MGKRVNGEAVADAAATVGMASPSRATATPNAPAGAAAVVPAGASAPPACVAEEDTYDVSIAASNVRASDCAPCASVLVSTSSAVLTESSNARDARQSSALPPLPMVPRQQKPQPPSSSWRQSSSSALSVILGRMGDGTPLSSSSGTSGSSGVSGSPLSAVAPLPSPPPQGDAHPRVSRPWATRRSDSHSEQRAAVPLSAAGGVEMTPKIDV